MEFKSLSIINYPLSINIMCLAIPGKLIEIREENGLKMGTVDISGALTKACLEYVPEIAIGQYTIVHAGFALKIIDEEEAAESLKLWDELMRAQRDG
ncbi:HypC/HybG/HupF family hydrogenase formation chaperone [Chlorobaculum sp. 24CR]|nr:HypC/HybG/HupF family hydrogenase formation chaperone [Chlorobaculum sp. 24CR]